jgi:hypothetical protein
MTPTTARKRATAKKTKPKKRKFGRCPNCDKRFEKTRPNKKFCTGPCKDEWHNTGGVSFAKYAAVVETRVNRAERRLREEMRAQVSKEIRQAKRDMNATVRERFRAITKVLRALKLSPELIEELTRNASQQDEEILAPSASEPAGA